MDKANIIAALREFAEQRPGIEPGNYGTWRDYRNESASVTRDLHDARELIRACEWRDSITAEGIREAFRAYSGRLSLSDDGRMDYCTGQYFPTEYRRAVASVCASALWDYTRKNYPALDGHGLRQVLRREFGARLARRYFN